MDTGFLATLNQLVQTHPVWLVALAFVFALFESLAIIGIFIPGIILLFMVGAVIGTDLQLFLWCWAGAALGALIGDVISHWLGWRFRARLPGIWPLSRRPDLLIAGEAAVASHGSKGIFIGRFVGPMRPIVPMVAGMMGMRSSHFLRIAVPACILWAPVYLLPGMLFGASLELAAEFAGRLAIVLLVVVLGLWLVIWLTRVVYNFTARRSGWWLKSLIRWSSSHPVVGRAVAPLFEPGRREMISVSLLGLLLLVSMAALLGALAAAPFAVGAWDAERYVAGWAASMRSHFADPLFVVLSLAGDLRVMGLLAGLMTLLLLVTRRANAAWHWLVATAGGWLLAELLNGFMSLMIDSPEAMPLLGEVPHRGITLTTIVFGFFAVMVAKDISARRRKWPYLAGSGLLALICFAHFYLGRASASGILAALALATAWSSLVGIGYRQRALPRQHPGVLAAAFYLLAVIIAAVHVHGHYHAMLEASRLAPPQREMARTEWLDGGWREMPEKRSRIGWSEVQRFDFQYAGNLDRLGQRLVEHGWRPPQDRQVPLIVTLVAARPDPERMPHLPRDYAGRPENLLLVLPLEGRRVATVRLWTSGARLVPGEAPVWLGQVRIERIGRFIGLFNRWRDVTAERREAMETMQAALEEGEVQMRDDLWLITM